MKIVKALMILGMLVSGMPAFAADLETTRTIETKTIDKNCYIEIFEDDNFDVDDPHLKLQGPHEYPTLNNLEAKDWNNDIESVIVGSNATVRAYEDKEFKGTELAFVPGQRVQNLGKLDMANDIESMKIVCGK